MDRSYRLGILVVSFTVLVWLGLCSLTVDARRAQAPAGEDLGENALALGPFQLVERSGRTVTDADLADQVWVASFIFTRCPLSCPRITSVMKGLQDKFAGSGVKLVSVTVDPDHDTPEVLSDYAKRFQADPDRWWFLTGPKPSVTALVTQRFKLGLVATGETDQQAGAEAFMHSSRLALVDRGKVVGFFDSNDAEKVASLIAKARGLAHPDWVRRLPAVNATLNGSCALLLTLGWIMVRKGRYRGHAACMISGVVVSALFLACYLLYHYEVGSVPFRGQGPIRLIYFTILGSHTTLATFGVVPLVTLTLTHALRRRFERHARIAGVTFPIWMYVSVTGVIIYMMLYQMPVTGSV